VSDTTPRTERPKTATRDLDDTRDRLTSWLTGQLPAGATPEVADLSAPPTNGMSSETILFVAGWVEDGEARASRLVARIAPDPANAPVFPTYDMAAQFETMRLVRELSDVPVPRPLWVEEDPHVLGQPFFVMEHVEGVVPPDVMPYNFGDSWLFHADRADQDRLLQRSLETLAALHAIPDPAKHFGFLHDGVPGDTPLRRHYESQIAAYYRWATDVPSPLLERCFQWLEDNWPQDEGPTVLSWGDARIGNMLFHDFEPVAVLDWEMASLGPREIDLAWFQFLHRWFEDIAVGYGLPGMPHYMQRPDVIAAYERISGHRCRDMDWYSMLAATRHGVVTIRTSLRGVQFGEREMPDDVDDLIMHRAALEQMIEGTYWTEGK
jgi:aminoglycoside phosphotransferase (APT) family kinase protein